MLVAVLGDLHFGKRADSIQFHNYDRKFFDEVFFPYVLNNGIKTIIQTGDLFDRRKYISFNTLHQAKRYFFDKLSQHGLQLITYPGNHDVYFRNSIEVNSIDLVLAEYIEMGFITNYIKPTTIDLDGLSVDIIPWICSDNEKEIYDFMANSKSPICFGHFEITGFEMDKGAVCIGGIDRNIFNRYEMVISGHFHHRSTDGQIYYVGTPGEITWADYGDGRGFHVLDTSTRDLIFHKNPNHMFHKIIYDDRDDTLDSVRNRDYAQYTDTMVKVIVAAKTNPVLYDIFLDNLYKANPLEVNIVEDFTDYSEISDADIVDQSDDTVTAIEKMIDNIEIGLDRGKLKLLMREIYLEALNMETEE